MFLGPGYNSDGISEVFSLPTKSSGLALANCTIPVFSMPDISNSVGFVHDGYLQICGGHTNYGSSCGWHTFDCYQLKESAWVATTPLMVTRNQAASVMLQDGSVLVSGGDGSSSRLYAHLQSSEVLTASAGWSAAIELPSAREGHCMLQLTTGQLFLHGGSDDEDRFGDTFISTDMSTWVTKASSQDARSGHACVEHGGYIWLGGGSRPMWFGTTEKYDLSTNSWTSGPDLPNYGNYGNGEFITHDGKLMYAGGDENKNIYQLNTEQNGWIKIGEMSMERLNFPMLVISENVCKGVRQVPPPP